MKYKRIRIFPYSMRNSCSLDLVNDLIERGYDCLKVKSEGKYVRKDGDLVINWGSSKEPLSWDIYPCINDPHSLSYAIDKIETLSLLQDVEGVNIPEWSKYHVKAKEWLRKGYCVVGRKLVSSFGGKGIKIMNSIEEWEPCPLYTLYKKKKKEFRLHVFNGEVIDITEKRKRKGAPKTDGKIRSWDNGWVFCHENVDIQEEAKSMAINAVLALGLDFGAVDMIWNEHENKYYVLEVNTAPGIEGTTVTKYADAIIKIFNGGV